MATQRSERVYNWTAKFGGLAVSEAKRLRQLEDENAKQERPRIQYCTENASVRYRYHAGDEELPDIEFAKPPDR